MQIATFQTPLSKHKMPSGPSLSSNKIKKEAVEIMQWQNIFFYLAQQFL